MASVSVFDLTRFTSLAAGDVLPAVDISNTTQNAHGSLLSITVTNFFGTVPVPVIVTSSSANAMAVGRQGTTNPAFLVATNTASSATGLQVTAAAAAGGLAVAVISSGANENLTVDAKGSGTITLGGTSTGNIVLVRAVTLSATLGVTGATTLSAALTYGGVTLSNAVTGTGNMVLSASPTFTGTVTAAAITATANASVGGLSTTLEYSGSLTADTHNLAIGDVFSVRLDANGAYTISGIVPTRDGQVICLQNISDDLMGLAHQSANSTEANRIICPNAAQFNLEQLASAWLRYDGVTDRWRVLARL